MYLTALTHRDQLFEVASRWLADRVDPDDGRLVTEIFIFERIITAPLVRALVADLGSALATGPLWMERVQTKDAVRQALAAAAHSSTPRVRELVERYRRRPEEFFPQTPVFMTLVTRQDGTLFAMVRRKRLRRIAEKSSRKVANQLASAIEIAARALADRRAARAGVPLSQLVSPLQIMEEEFIAAERIVADRILSGEIQLAREALSVNDVIGVKLVGTPHVLQRVERAVSTREGTSVCHREVHQGSYAGTHLLVDVELPPAAAIADTMRGADWSFAAGRGLSPNSLETDFYEYLESGSRTFRIELVLTTFEDLVESELGRCIHEARILEQRGRVRYTGRIAENASYIIEYLLQVAISPTVKVRELPIRVGGRYLRDTLWRAVFALGGGEPAEWVLPNNSDGRRPVVPPSTHPIAD